MENESEREGKGRRGDAQRSKEQMGEREDEGRGRRGETYPFETGGGLSKGLGDSTKRRSILKALTHKAAPRRAQSRWQGALVGEGRDKNKALLGSASTTASALASPSK